MNPKIIFRDFLSLPGQCPICGQWCRAMVCPACLAEYHQVHQRCPWCGLRLLQQHPSFGAGSEASASPPVYRCLDCEHRADGIASCVAIVSYQYPWNDLVADLKYGGQLAISQLMAYLTLHSPEAVRMLALADLVIGLPLTEQRLRERGYNQAYEWARRVAPKKVVKGLLVRIGNAVPQASLSRAERLAHAAQLEVAFQVEPSRYQHVKGKCLVLMDDVQTTGTTLHAAALALRRAGATEVHALVFARTEIG